MKLARTHLLEQIRNSQNPRHREMLEKALADLEKQLTAKDGALDQLPVLEAGNLWPK